ncbi:MAG TPA: flavohemoglobin expression-modulating QEGLA motif protein [Bacteroidales bacterium]|nr:flavohemoglobin expression-modulating QEGLA motif protein [Bacteroidales bacterium]
MLRLKISEIINLIHESKHFEAECIDFSFYIKVDEYVPFVGFAIHNGHNLRKELKSKCLLSDHERWYEEDPQTLNFISSLPIVMAANDSRYEYDLNRDEKTAIYNEAWGKKVWKSVLTNEEKEESLNKHRNFYKVVDALMLQLESKFKSSVVFDIHSYNYKRYDFEPTVFNLGTENVNYKQFAKFINYWLRELRKINLPGIETTVGENEIFKGNGFLLKHITNNFKNTLVFATEIKKVYCNEENGEIYPLVIDELTDQLKKAIINTAAYFAKNRTNLTVIKKNRMLSSELDKDLLKVDKQLFNIANDFEIISLINPINIDQARKMFFKSKYASNPEFVYNQLSINPFEFKRKLYDIPVEKISDISLRILYQDVIDSYSDKIDIIASIGTDKFLYNSLRYFGEPNKVDIKNAEYILHSSNSIDQEEVLNLSSTDVLHYFKDITNQYGFQCKVEISRKIISKVLNLNNKKTLYIRKDASFSEKSLHALAEHEIGVHMLTTINSRLQPLNIFRLGTPLNTHTQEGLAILSEYLSGNITINRLQILALRVLTIEKMLQGLDFKQTFSFLMDTKFLNETQAFFMTARIFRGGGFTKDHLYLKGFKDILKYYNDHNHILNLLIGKTSLKYKNVIEEMIERKIFLPPKFKTRSILNPVQPDPIIKYILDGLN